jgi:hypothetical protein
MATLYISTPINSRPEKTLKEKLQAARHRVNLLVEVIRDDSRFDKYDRLVSTFNVNPPSDMEMKESVAMGRCIEAVMEAEAVYLDHAWQSSKGCNLEYRAAKIYEKQIYEHDKM